MTTTQPLAERMRPTSLKEFEGQEHLVGKEKKQRKILRSLIEGDKVPSMILWGPPGSGKTTLARIIAKETSAHFIQVSAINAGVKDIREAVESAEGYARLGTKTILFIDEVHRFNKAQQDAFLPSVEDGTITLIGATTENPSFEVNGALLSRCRTFVLEALGEESLIAIIESALKDKERGLGRQKSTLPKKEKEYLAVMSNGDARTALNALELAAEFAGAVTPAKAGVLVGKKEDSRLRGNDKKESRNDKGKNLAKIIITKDHIEQALQKSNLLYDKNGEEHYNIISALHKSMRGGNADAALYYLARMLEGGEDPLYIARRIVRFASEDIGLANSFALPQATAAYDACRFIGMPECGVNLAQAVVYMAKSKKSISVYEGYKEAMGDVKEKGNLTVPLHLRNLPRPAYRTGRRQAGAPTKLMKDLDYGKDYKYTPRASDEENKTQEFMPDELKGKKYL